MTYSAPNFVPDFNFSYTSMFSQSPYMQGSPPPQFPGAFGFQSTPQVTPQVTPQATPPPWAVKLLDDVNMIKQKFQSIDKIEQTVNLINTKVTDLETKMASLETRLTANEQSCQFISDANEQNKNELKQAKENILNLQTKCTGLQKDTKTLKQEHREYVRGRRERRNRFRPADVAFFSSESDKNVALIFRKIRCFNIHFNIHTCLQLVFDLGRSSTRYPSGLHKKSIRGIGPVWEGS